MDRYLTKQQDYQRQVIHPQPANNASTSHAPTTSTKLATSKPICPVPHFILQKNQCNNTNASYSIAEQDQRRAFLSERLTNG